MNLGKDPRRRKARMNLLLLWTITMKINKIIRKVAKAVRDVFINLEQLQKETK